METFRCLILDFNAHNRVASCYYKETFDLIRVKIGNDLSPNLGQFLVFNLAQPPVGDEILISQNARVEDPKKEDCIGKNADGTIQISSWIAFSSDPRHRTFERKLAFADWYGFLDSSEVDVSAPKYKKSMAFKSFIVVSDLDYKRKKTQLFKVSLIKGPLKNDIDDLINKMREEEEKLLALQPQRPSRKVDNGPRIRPRSRSHESRRPHDVGAFLANLAIVTPRPFEAPAQLPSGREARPLQAAAPTVNSFLAPAQPSAGLGVRPLPAAAFTVNPFMAPAQSSAGLGTRPLPVAAPIANASSGMGLPIASPYHFNDDALIIRQKSDDHFVAWLFKKKEAALLSVSKVRMVRIGVMYKCSYELKPDNLLEIIKIEKALEHLPFEIEQAEFVKAKIHVNLCSPNTKCAIWSFHMGTAFLNSPDVGVVTIADFVDTPVGRNMSWQATLREYLGEKSAENMLCVCELVKQKVPKKLTDSFMSDDFASASQNFSSNVFLSEWRYLWQVKTICSAGHHHEFRENRLKSENLGENADQYAEDDEIARIKRENKHRVQFGSNIIHDNYDQQPCSSSSSSNRF